MPSTGRGRFALSPRIVPWAWLYGVDGKVIAEDWFWGGAPPVPTGIPYTWIRPPVRFRPDPPINTAEVSRINGSTARAADANHRDTLGYGEYTFRATLDTDIVNDPSALAGFVVDTYSLDPPRQRIPVLAFVLNSRTEDERHLILGRTIGDRIVITDPPATWPEGAESLVIEGIRHDIGADLRLVTWVTTPVVGSTAGTPGPWFRVDESQLSGTDLLPF